MVLKRNNEEVTHLVVKEKDAPHEEVLVPLAAVRATTPDSIDLSYTRDKVDALQRFLETDYIQVHIPHYAGGAYSLAPYDYAGPQIMSVKHEAIPDGELAVCRGARVKATDGYVGRVDELLMDPEDDRVTHLVLREGHLWGQRDVSIPVSEIASIEDNAVHLKIDKRTIESLPAVSVH